MKKKILVTGIAGSGKTTTCNQLQAMGYEAYGIEEIPGMFSMYHPGTDDLFTDFKNADVESMSHCDWRCDIATLQNLMDSQEQEVAFYCGTATNTEALLPMFDASLLLKASTSVLYSRLLTREGTEACGNTEETRQVVLGWKSGWEDYMQHKGMQIIAANGTPLETAELVLREALRGSSSEFRSLAGAPKRNE